MTKYILNLLLFTFLIITTHSQPASTNIHDGIQYISNKLETVNIIAVGETHDKVEVTNFYIELVNNKKIANNIDYIVIEMGNSLYQPILDKYLAGENVPEKELYNLWRDHTNCMLNDGDNTGLIRLIKSIREINLSSTKKIKVLVADPPIDWNKIECLQEFYKYLAVRDQHYTKTVVEKIIEPNKKAILIMGNSHFNKLKTKSMIEKNLENPITAINNLNKGDLILINTITTSDFPYEKLSALPKECVIETSDTWLGELEIGSPFIKNQKLKDQTDAILYLGSRKELTTEKPQPFNDEDYEKELERRNNLPRCTNK